MLFKKFKKIFKLIAAFVLLPIAIMVSLYSLDQNGFFKIDKISIKVNSQNTQKNFVNQKLAELQTRLDRYRGISLWKAPLREISEALKEEKWIQAFQLSRSWPAGLELLVDAESIEILVVSQDGIIPAQVGSSTEPAVDKSVAFIRPITKTGKILDKIKSSTAPNAIVTHDSLFLKNQNIRDGAVQVILTLPHGGPLSAEHVSEIGFDKLEGYWIKLLKSETKINYGTELFELKSTRIAQVMEYLDSRDLKARVIDANLSKKVLVRLQQNP